MSMPEDRDTESLRQSVIQAGNAMVVVGRRFSWLRKARENGHRPVDIITGGLRLADTASIAAYDLQAASRVWKDGREAAGDLPFDPDLRRAIARLRQGIQDLRSCAGGMSSILDNSLRLLDAVKELEGRGGPQPEIDSDFLARMDGSALHPVLSILRIGSSHDDFWREMRLGGLPVTGVPGEIAGPVSSAVFIPPEDLDAPQMVKLGAMAANGLDIHVVDARGALGGAPVATLQGRIIPVATPLMAVDAAFSLLRDAVEGISPMSSRRLARIAERLATEDAPEPEA